MVEEGDLQAIEDLVITSEEEAFAVLKLAQEDRLPPYGKIVFQGWPSLSIYLKGEKFDQSLTPTVMRSLLDFQKSFYQAYSVARYNTPAKRLSEAERKALEIKVDVRKGSSDLGIDFQRLAEKFIDLTAGKMGPTELVVLIVSIAVLYFGRSAYGAYLDTQVALKSKETTDETQKKMLDVIKFSSEQETERLKIVSSLALGNDKLREIQRSAESAQSEVVKALSSGDSAAVAGMAVEPELAEALTKAPRRSSSSVRLDAFYKIERIDWSDAVRVKVDVRSIATGERFGAVLKDDTLTGKYKEVLREAEWGRTKVYLRINARRLGDDEYRDAEVIAAFPGDAPRENDVM